MQQLSEEQLRRRNSRSKAIAWSLVAFMVIVFMVTMVKMTGNMAIRP